MTSAALTYVRHAMAPVVEGVRPSEWHLDDAGRESAWTTAAGLELDAPIGALVASTEPKAMATAEAIAECWGATATPEPRLREATRPWIGPGYRAMAHRYLRGEALDGWEPHAELAGRVQAAVDDAVGRADGVPVVVVSHGLALAIHLGERLGRAFDRESFCSGLTFPDAWVLDERSELHRSRAQLS